MTTTSEPPSADVVAAFHAGIYSAAFPGQIEPLETWLAALRGEYDYELSIEIVDGGGIAYERYPASGCGLLTYCVVDPTRRRGGIGRALIEHAIADLRGRGAPIIFGEVNRGSPRIEQFRRWGARVCELRYVQPSLGAGRDRGLELIAFDDRDHLDGSIVRTWLDEFYRITEGAPPDRELTEILDAIPERVKMR